MSGGRRTTPPKAITISVEDWQPLKMPIPVIDLFAGPGGLGEGFSSFEPRAGERAFRIALSVEMDKAAHETLELRSFFRQFPARRAPDDYYKYLRKEISRCELFAAHPKAAESAKREAWLAELGKESARNVDDRIIEAVGDNRFWILCGGPPCQAYSVIGRSRTGGIDENDHRLYLYREYLRILAVHQPSMFVFENVKGILSSSIKGSALFQNLARDLSNPSVSFGGSGHRPRYKLYPLGESARKTGIADQIPGKPGDFVIRCEDYEIPQMRHRVVLLGVREDLSTSYVPLLRKQSAKTPVASVLNGLPRLRSGLTRREDTGKEWVETLSEILDNNLLNGIPQGRATALRKEIQDNLARVSCPRAGRGSAFISMPDLACKHRPEWYCDSRLGGVCNHESRPHMPMDLHRYLFSACFARLFGKSPELRDFPPGLLPNHRNVHQPSKKEYFDDRFRVQIGQKPSTTVTSHLAKDGHYFIHYDPTQCRSITVREAARIQTFPDNYYFCGTRTQQYVQVGNAVPPLLALQIAEIASSVLQSWEERNGAIGRKALVVAAC